MIPSHISRALIFFFLTVNIINLHSVAYLMEVMCILPLLGLLYEKLIYSFTKNSSGNSSSVVADRKVGIIPNLFIAISYFIIDVGYILLF